MDCYRLLDEQRAAAAPPVTVDTLGRLVTGCGSLIDRLALKAMERLFLSSGRPNLSRDLRARLDELRGRYASPEVLTRPDLYYRPTDDPTDVRLVRLGRLADGARERLTWRSAYQPFDPGYAPEYAPYTENAENRVLLLRHDGGSGRPAVICIHAWCGGQLAVEERVFGARALYRRGLDVALPTMPFHGRRTPRQARFSGQLFPSRELRRSNEAFGQAIADLRWLARWLRQQGASSIGVIGMSLGGYLAALWASLDPDLSFVVPIVAPASFADLLWDHGRFRPGRAEAEQAGFTLDDFRALWSIHCPLVHRLRPPRERALIVTGDGDRIVPARHQLALWEHWGRPELLRFRGGHLLQFGHLTYMRSVRRWLSERCVV